MTIKDKPNEGQWSAERAAEKADRQAPDAVGRATVDRSPSEDELRRAELDELLEEALEETFPASDPVSSLRFVPSRPARE